MFPLWVPRQPEAEAGGTRRTETAKDSRTSMPICSRELNRTTVPPVVGKERRRGVADALGRVTEDAEPGATTGGASGGDAVAGGGGGRGAELVGVRAAAVAEDADRTQGAGPHAVDEAALVGVVAAGVAQDADAGNQARSKGVVGTGIAVAVVVDDAAGGDVVVVDVVAAHVV